MFILCEINWLKNLFICVTPLCEVEVKKYFGQVCTNRAWDEKNCDIERRTACVCLPCALLDQFDTGLWFALAASIFA